jgi:hypothetical protein
MTPKLQSTGLKHKEDFANVSDLNGMFLTLFRYSGKLKIKSKLLF